MIRARLPARRTLFSAGVRLSAISRAGRHDGVAALNGRAETTRPCMAGGPPMTRPIGAMLHDLRRTGYGGHDGDLHDLSSDDDLLRGRGKCDRPGRDHKTSAASDWLAGARREGGIGFGEPDEIRWGPQKTGWMARLHATHPSVCWGIDHRRVTFYTTDQSSRRLGNRMGRGKL